MTRNFGKGQGPMMPSILKESEYPISAAETAQPTDRTKGIGVAKWREVIFSVHPTSPDINDAGAVGWQIEFKIWRYKMLARDGTARPAGQWFAEEVILVSMDGDVATGGPMEVQLPTWDAEKMYLQPIASYGPDTWVAMVTCWGLVPRLTEDGGTCECEATGAGGAGGGAAVIQSMFDLIAHENYTYTNLRGDFFAERQSATTIDLSDVKFPVDERQILAIGLKRSGVTSRTRMWYRDKDLFVDYTAATGRITVAGFTINAADEVEVYLEGPSKIDDLDNMARRVRLVNPDAMRVTIDGEINLTLAEGGNIRYLPFNMAQDGLHFVSLHTSIAGDSTVNIEGTNDLARDTNETWDDITQQCTGFTQLDANTPDVIPFVAWVGYRRIRLVCDPGATGGSVDMWVMRSANGTTWSPIAYDGYHAATAGPQIMGEAVAVQPTAETAGYAARLITDLYHGLIGAPYIYATQADRTEEDDPIDTRDVGEKFEESNIDANTVFDYYIDMAHYTDLTLQLAVWTAGGGTIAVAVEFSDQDDGTAPNACIYVDTTLRRYGAATILGALGLAESIGDAAAGTPNPAVPNINMKWAHIEVTIASDPTDAAFELWTRRLWR